MYAFGFGRSNWFAVKLIRSRHPWNATSFSQILRDYGGEDAEPRHLDIAQLVGGFAGVFTPAESRVWIDSDVEVSVTLPSLSNLYDKQTAGIGLRTPISRAWVAWKENNDLLSASVNRGNG